MLYDLNIPWSLSQSPQELQRTIAFLSELGYHTIALNNTISHPIPADLTSPIPRPLPFTPPAKVNILTRVTIPISDTTTNLRLPAFVNAYQIIALRPTSEKGFMAACATVQEHSLISLDLTQRYDFPFKPKPLMTAVNRGIRFEICYAQAVLEDSAKRRNFISNCLGIFRGTRGRGLVVSSEAKSALGIRAPADVVNLLGVWGLGREMGLESIGVNPRVVVVNEGLKRTSFRGVVNVINGGERIMSEASRDNVITKGNDKGKRKAGESTQNVSKRHLKKLRLEALRSEKEVLNAKEDDLVDSPSESPLSKLAQKGKLAEAIFNSKSRSITMEGAD